MIKTAIVDNGRYETFHVGMTTFGLKVISIEHRYPAGEGDQGYTTVNFEDGTSREYFKTIELDKAND